MIPQDKHGNEVKKGDRVEVVHFGEHHFFQVDAVTEQHGVHYLTGTVSITVPATAVSLRADENPKRAPKEDSPVEHYVNAAGAPTSHTPVQHPPSPPKRRIIRGNSK